MPRWRTKPWKLQRAREMRQRATAAERLAWRVLRGRRLAGLKFRRQCLVAGFIVDFYCAELRLVLELDGPAHERPERQEYDCQRTAVLERYGLRVLRIGNADVSEEGLQSLILPLVSPSPATRERGQG